jgi:hypothetical protein
MACKKKVSGRLNYRAAPHSSKFHNNWRFSTKVIDERETDYLKRLSS